MEDAIRERIAVAFVLGLLAVAGLDRLLWSPPVGPAQDRASPAANPFPVFPAKSSLFVIPVPRATNASTRLTLASMQGLVNRDGAEVYLDEREELGNASSMLTFLMQRYGVSYATGDIPAAFARYLPRLDGICVFDPARPESVNVATVYAGLHRAAIAGPEMAPYLSRRYGIPILFDFAQSDWHQLGPSEAYDRSMRELYPQASHDLLSILPPNRFGIRDYLIAAKTFVFYYPQGAFTAGPGDSAATARILHATPRGIPILGWIDTPTITEESAFVELASREAKALVGMEDTPNLSVLTAFGRSSHWRQAPISPATNLENKTYAVLAVPDGDHLDFDTGRMRQMWDDPIRGTVPLTWSISPALADLAPPILEFYGTTAKAEDRFVAGPSGAGYVYPDYMGSGDLGPYLNVSRRYLEETGLDTTWLLNAFPASEVPYRDETLSSYVDALRPNGLVLDYADQPKTHDVWMQVGESGAAPVIRSTHLWTTKANFLAKLDAAAAAWGEGPHFLWVTVYPYRWNLTDAKAVLDEAGTRLPGGLEVVTPERLFAMIRQDFLERASREVSALAGDPLAALFSGARDSATAHLAAARLAANRNDSILTAREGSLALADVRSVRLGETLLAIASALAVLAIVLSTRKGVRLPGADIRASGPPIIALVGTFAAFFLVLRSSLAADFWTYPFVIVGLALSGFGVPLARRMEAIYPRQAPLVCTLLFASFAGLAFVTNAAFPLAAIGAVLVPNAILRRRILTPQELLMTFAFGAAIAFAVDVSPWSLAILIPFSVAPSFLLPSGTMDLVPRERASVVRGLALASPLVGLAAASTYSLSLRLDQQGAVLAVLAPFIMSAGIVLGIGVSRVVESLPRTRVQVVGLLVAAIAALALVLVQGTFPSALAVLLLVSSSAVFATSTLRPLAGTPEGLLSAVGPALVIASVMVLFFRMPPVAYSLSVGALPEALESGLYAPQILVALVALGGLVLITLRRVRARAAKHYAPDLDAGGSA